MKLLIFILVFVLSIQLGHLNAQKKQLIPLIKSGDTISLKSNEIYNGVNLSNLSNVYINGNGAIISGFVNYNQSLPLIRKPEVVAQNNRMLSYSEGTNGEYYAYRPSNQRWYIYRDRNTGQTGNGVFLNDYTNVSNNAYAIHNNKIYSQNYNLLKYSSAESGVILNNCKNIIIENVTVEGWDKRAIIIGYACENITIRNCTIRFVGWDGIYSAPTVNLKIENCYFKDIHGNAINTTGAEYSKYINNTFNRIGIWPARGEYNGNINYQPPCAIRHNKGNYCQIKQNAIDSIGYNGIAFYSCDYAQVTHNKISNTNLLIDDGGAIYTWAREKSGNLNSYWVIDSNEINKCIGTYWGIDDTNAMVFDATGIYIDDGNNGGKIRGNKIYKSTRALFIHNSQNIEIYDNQVYKCINGILFRNNHSQINISGCEFSKNFIQAEKYSIHLWAQSDNNRIWENNSFNLNNYVNPIFIIDNSAQKKRLTLQQWQNTYKQDIKSKSIPGINQNFDKYDRHK